MIRTDDTVAASRPGRLGALARDFQTRILNCSPTGCLLETNSLIEVGTIGSLRLVIDGREFADDVQVVRCQSIEGTGALLQLGMRFLWIMAPGRQSLRYAFSRPSSGRAGTARGLIQKAPGNGE